MNKVLRSQVYSYFKQLSLDKEVKRKEYLQNRFISAKDLQNNETLSTLFDLSLKKAERDRAFLLNRNKTVSEIADENFASSVFITLTSLKQPSFSFYKYDKKGFSRAIYMNKHINNDFNDFFRSFHKQKIFRTLLTAKNRLYVSVNEFTKNLTLHRHILQYLVSDEDSAAYCLTFAKHYEKHAESYEVGRSELVVSDNVFNILSKDKSLKKIKLKKEFILVNKSLDSIKSGSFLYIKRIKKAKDNTKTDREILTSYIFKYVMKNTFNNDISKLSDFEIVCKYLHSKLLIRRFNFSRYIFPKSLYTSLYRAGDEVDESDFDRVDKRDNYVSISKDFTLKELSYLKNSEDIKIDIPFSAQLNDDFVYKTTLKKFFDENFTKIKSFDDHLKIFTYESFLEEFDSYKSLYSRVDLLERKSSKSERLSAVFKDYFDDYASYDLTPYLFDEDFDISEHCDKSKVTYRINDRIYFFKKFNTFSNVHIAYNS